MKPTRHSTGSAAREGTRSAKAGAAIARRAAKAPPISARPVTLQRLRAGLLRSLALEPAISRSVALIR
jgi:hypothetical protein